MDTSKIKIGFYFFALAGFGLTILLLMPVSIVQSAATAPNATILVNTTTDEFGDGSSCSLREAIQAANTDSDFGGCVGDGSYGAEVINLPAGIYILNGISGEDNNAIGDLDILDSLTIQGEDARTTFIQGGSSSPVDDNICADCDDRVMHVNAPDETVELVKVTIRYGKPSNGLANGIGSPGGGIYHHAGTLTLDQCYVSSNRTGDGGYGVSADGGQGGDGGGIYNDGGTLHVKDSVISNNETGAGADSSSGNGGWGGGGAGIFSISSTANTVVEGGVISNNVTGPGGDGGPGGYDGARGDGGGLMAMDSSTLTVDRVTVMKNSSRCCAGVYSYYNGIMEINRSTLTGNIAEAFGGGAGNMGSFLRISHSTISANRAYIHGGGVYDAGLGNTELIHVTITNNTANLDNNSSGDGGGIWTWEPLTMTHTIVAGNIDKSGNEIDCAGPIHSGGYNIVGIGDNSLCDFQAEATDQIGTIAAPLEVKLLALADNGGPTLTHALRNDSPAVDQIPGGTNGCVTGSRDQRGIVRFPPCDIGAYEIDVANNIFLPLLLR